MWDAQQFYRAVQQQAGLPSWEDAVRATQETLHSLKYVLPLDVILTMQAQLPAELAALLDGGSGAIDPLVDREVFVGPLMNVLDTEAAMDDSLGGLDLVSVYAGDDATRRVQAVFAVLKQALDPHTVDAIEASLPGEVGHWFREAQV
ncbi:MAG: hypothetical protein BAA04_00500 [Firmicutes bacterium ZCTH02-B6]|nr:MAG: hypothetical protein BAA04_00500 [Firmicutes bacterium ZCTH02-B6]